MALNYFPTATALLAALVSTAAADCESFGIDYQDGGSYFQNINLNKTFTALQQFTGCVNDTAYNILVDPNGDQSECSQTPLLPDNTPQQIICSQWTNPEMYSGDWSILIVSNNGNNAPIAYQRDFYLAVGTPNVTVTVQTTTTSTVIVTSTETDVQTITSTITPLPTTDFRGNISSTTIGANGTVTTTSYFSKTAVVTVTITQSCTNEVAARAVAAATTTSHPTITLNPDHVLQVHPTILGELNAVASSIACAASLDAPTQPPFATPLPASAKYKKAIIARRNPSPKIKRAFVRQRAARLHKRGPDSFTTTVYDSATETTTSFVTVTHWSTYVASVTAAATRAPPVRRQRR